LQFNDTKAPFINGATKKVSPNCCPGSGRQGPDSNLHMVEQFGVPEVLAFERVRFFQVGVGEEVGVGVGVGQWEMAWVCIHA
jgi:hypothetical protein